MKFIDLGFKRGQVLAFKIRGLKAKETGKMSPFYKNGDEGANRKRGASMLLVSAEKGVNGLLLPFKRNHVE